MPNTVTNARNNASFIVDKDETVLAAALRNGHVFAYGCQMGLCGDCKTDLVSGEIDYGDYDESTLTEDEKADGKILLCQAKANSDIVIDAEELTIAEGIEIKTLPTRINELNVLADDVMQVFLRLPNTQTFNFLPGQYIHLLLQEGKQRSFSIANLPDNAKENGIELHLRLVPGGFYTPRFFSDAKLKDIIRIQGPFGTYYLRKEDERPIIMVAGGTGFAPIKGLIEDAIDSGLEQPIHLFWGARASQDLYMDELCQSWAKQHDNIQYTPVLSEPDADWQGASGFVHETVLASYPDLSNHCAYVSGPPIMIDAVTAGAVKNGLNQELLYTDSFDYAAALGA